MNKPAGTLHERKTWYRSARDADIAAALLTERSPNLLDSVIRSLQPWHTASLTTVAATLIHERNAGLHGRAVHRGIDGLASNWKTARTPEHEQAVAWLLSEEFHHDPTLGMRLWDTLTSPEIINSFTSHPDPRVRILVARSRYVTEANLLQFVTDDEVTRVYSIGSNTTSAYTPTVAAAVIACGTRKNLRDALSNPRTPADLAATTVIEALSGGSDLLNCSIALFASQSVEDRPHIIRVVQHLLETNYTTQTQQAYFALGVVHQMIHNRERNAIPDDLLARLIVHLFPLYNGTGPHEWMVTAITAYKALDVPSSLPNWTVLARDAVDLLVGLPIPESAATAFGPIMAYPDLPVDLAERMLTVPARVLREHAISNTNLPAAVLASFAATPDYLTFTLRFRIVRYATNEPLKSHEQDDLDVLLPALPHSNQAAEAVKFAMWKAATVADTATLRRFTKHSEPSVRRFVAKTITPVKDRIPYAYRSLVQGSASRDAWEEAVDRLRAALTDMLDDADAAVRRNVIRNPLTPFTSVEPFRNDSKAEVRHAAAQRFLAQLSA